MKQGRGKCSMFKAFKLTYLHVLQQLVCHLKLTQFGWVGLHGRMTSSLDFQTVNCVVDSRVLKYFKYNTQAVARITRLAYMNVLTDLLALHVHGPCFTNPLITVYGFVLGQIAFDLNKPTADQLAIQIRNLALYLYRSVVVSVLHAEICRCVNVACFFLNFCHVVQHETKWPFTHPPNQKNFVSCLMTLQFYLSKLAAHFLPLNFYHFA